MSEQNETRWSVVTVTMFSAVIGAAHVGKLVPALPDLRADLDLDLVTAGWVASVFAFTGLVLGIASGLAGDRFGATRTLVCGLVICATGGTLGRLSESATPLLVSRNCWQPRCVHGT